MHSRLLSSALARCLVALTAASTVTLLSPVAHAKETSAKAKQSVGVGVIAGPHGKQLRAHVLKILKANGSYIVTDVQGLKPGASSETYQRMAQGILADALVVGEVSKGMNLTLTVYAADGSRLGSVQIEGGSYRKLSRAVDNQVEISLADPLASAGTSNGAAAGAMAATMRNKSGTDEDEEPELDEDSTEDDEDTDEADAWGGEAGDGPAPRPFELLAGVRLEHRSFEYTGQPRSAALVPYSISGPAVLLSARLYPAALFGRGALAHVGLTGRAELGGLLTNTQYPQPGGGVITLKNHVSEWRAGLRVRLPLAPHELGVFAQYGVHSFALVGDEDPQRSPYALVPDVHYHYLRFGLDAHFQFSKFLLGGHVAPRFLTAMKELDKGRVWFPGATGSALDFGIMAGWVLAPWLDVVAGADLVRYGFDFNNIPNDRTTRVVAGGATDTYLSGWAGAMIHLDGKGSSDAATVEGSTETSTESEE